MKKGMVVLLALVLFFAAACAPAQKTVESTEAPLKEEAVGTEAPQEKEPSEPSSEMEHRIGNFVLQCTTPMDVIGATGYLFVHEGNGAQLLYLASSDPNVSFDITFRTPALDDTGKAHVFEHMTICGSQKYPDANLFFPFYNRTYNTFVNAATYQGMTTYPVSSLSEEQLMTMMDYYLSGVFEPLMQTEPRMVDREAWRYELSDADAPITIAGTVYSEMQGALSPEALSQEYIKSTMFKDGLTAHISGGLPESIRTLTWEDLSVFHDTYYHPSNALIILYGKLDYQKFIQYIDEEYVSKFDRQQIDIERGRVTPYTETAFATYQAPVEASAKTEDASYLSYGFSDNEMPMADALAMNVLCSLLNNSASPLQQLASQRMPGIRVTASFDVDLPAPTLSISASSVNESDRDPFVQLVDDAIAELAGGVDPDLLDASLSMTKLSLMLTAEDNTLGVNASQSIALYWTNFGSTNFYADYPQVTNSITSDSMTALIQKYLQNNAYRGVSLTVPAPGLAEENAKKLADELAEKKAAMSDEDVQKMVEKAQDFAAWSGAAPDEAIVDQLAIMTVDKLPELLPEGELTDVTEDGTRFITAKADVGDVSQMTVSLDASSVPVDKLCDATIAASLLGKVDTAEHSKEELNVLVQRYLGVLTCSLSQAQAVVAGQPDHYTFDITTLGLGEKAQQGYALVEEVLLHTDFTDIGNLKNQLVQQAYGIRSSLDNDPLTLQMRRTCGMFSDVFAVKAHVTGLDMYARLNELAALADSDPQQLTANLRDALAILLNGYQATVMCVGSDSANTAYVSAAKALLKQIPAVKTTPVDYSAVRLPKRNEALVNNLTVHMNLLVAPTEGYSGKYTPIAALIGDRYLVPQLRNVLGAYGAYASFDDTFNILYSYRDPNLASTFRAFADLPEYLRNMELSQDDVDSYIVGSYNNLLPAGGKLSQALQLVNNRFNGVTDEMRLGWMREAKATTAEDVHHTSELVEAMLKNGARSVSGAESTLNEAAELTDVTVRPDETAGDASKENPVTPAA